MSRDPDLPDIFYDYAVYAFRLETLDRYAVEVEAEDIRRYLSGHPVSVKREPGYRNTWHELVRDSIRQGKRFHRVHVVQGPLSDYLRWECEWGYAWDADNTGQQVGIIDTAEVPRPEGLPDEDFWLFDDKVAYVYHYDDEGRFIGEDEVPESEVPRYVRCREIALAHAVPFEEYWAAHPEYHRENWLVKPDS